MHMKKRIVFMGTPFFASEVLEHLHQMESIEVVGVVAQPDRKMSRRKKIVYSEVKEVALRENLTLFQPEKVKDLVNELKTLNPDKIITCAYGQFLPQAILDFGVLNIHASLLPKYRGGAPMQHAIMNGEKTTGITLMESVLKMDAGPIYCKKEVEIDELDTLTSLELKLIQASKDLLDESLLGIVKGDIKAIPQDESQVTFSFTIKKEDEFIDFNRPVVDVYNHIRALIEVPCGYSLLDGKRIKFCQVELGETSIESDPSLITFNQPDYFEVNAIDGSIKVIECQLEGKQRQKAVDIYNGYQQQFHLKRLNDEN